MCSDEVADKPLPAAFWIGLVAFPAAFFALIYQIDGASVVDDRWWVREVEYAITTSVTPPDVDALWWRAELPVHVSQPGARQINVWWRLTPSKLLMARDAEPWTVLLPTPAGSSYELWRDGELLGQRGDADGSSVARNPTWFELPGESRLEPSAHLLLRSTVHLPDLYMAPLVFGPSSEVAALRRHFDTGKRELLQANAAMMSLMMLILGAVYVLRHRKDPVYGWYAIVLFLWTLYIAYTQIENPPFGDARFWNDLSIVTLGWFLVCTALFVNRFIDDPQPRFERAFVAWGCMGTMGTAALELSGRDIGFFQHNLWDPSLLVIGLYIVGRLAVATWRKRDFDTMALLSLTVFVLIVGLRDFAFTHPAFEVPGTMLYLHYAAAFGLVVFSVILIHRFVQALDSAESLNEVLEARVAEKVTELDRQYARSRLLERDQILLDERQRLLREMHDGLGGHLVHALAVAERDDALAPIVPPLKYALEDLRLIIDSLDPTESAFDAVFSALRARFSRTARSLGLNFSWEIDPAVADLDPNPHEVLMVARIVQEAVTNVIKHAAASVLSVNGSVDASGYVNIAVADDGVGGLDHVNGRGRGLTSMRSRARELGGELLVEPLEPGTCVSLRWHPEH